MASLHHFGRTWCILLTLLFLSRPGMSQTCSYPATLSNGYTVSISNVVANMNGTYTISLTVVNNGCSGCKKLNSLSIQAATGTYSNVNVQVLSGAVTYASISMGPVLSGCSFTGFRVNNTNGIGNGQAASFRVTYTLTSLQNQQVQLKTSSPTLTTTFTVAQFQNVLSCLNPPPSNILPYFPPYANKLYDIIGVELTSLYYAYQANGTYISDDIFQILGNSVRITIRTQPGQHANAIALLTTAQYGLVQEFDDPTNNVINGTLPIPKLLSLNLLPNLLVSARPIYPALSLGGLITTQGDTALRSFRARPAFGVDGQGIKVGVLSDSYNTIVGNPAADDVLRKDLPGTTNPLHPNPVQVLQDYPFGTRTDEGRAMLQIVHDIAPGADLAFRTGFLGAVDFAKGIRELQQAGCGVIVDDVSYISEPFFRDGVVAQAVDAVKAQGVSYFTAAGNFGSKSWQGTFAPVAAPAGVTGQAHNFASGFGGTDILQNITLYQGDYTLVFQWDDGTPGLTTASDFDIYLANNNGNTLFGFNRMNVGGDPIEILPFKVTADSVQSNIVIVRESGSGNAQLKYVVYRGQLKVNEYTPLNASTICGQANAAGAMAVGAVLYTNTPAYGNAPSAASFSSRGGTPVNGVVRNKPDIMAPNGVNTSVNLGGVNIDGDAFPNFFGTSASAPHAAGVAALLAQAKQKYYGSALTPDNMRSIMQSTAIDMGTPGFDVASGPGYLEADRALASLANPAPIINALQYDTTKTPGRDTLLLKIRGVYLRPTSSVWFNGAPLINSATIQGDTAIVTTIYPYTALYPAIQVYNPPMPGTNGLDGGLSNPLYFSTKQTILVRVDNKSKKYGEVLPPFTAQYSLEGIGSSTPLNSAGLTSNEVGRIHAIGLTTIATAQSNVGLWGITANAADPLSPNSTVIATDTLDRSLLRRYNIAFVDGLLTIDPTDLVITPRDTTITYGQPIEGIHFDYAFNSGVGAVDMNANDSLVIMNAVRTAHGTALVNAVGLVRGTALVNNNGQELLTDSVLHNFSFMISQAVAVTRGTALVNGELIDASELYTASALTNAQSRLVRGTALVNAYTLVRGTALVNTLDSLGNITNTSSLTNASGLTNSSGLLNSSTITLNSNSQTLVILGDDDVSILSGNAPGDVTTRSVNLVTGNTVGTHLIVPGTFLSNNFNVRYGLGHITILPAPAQISINAGSLTQTYDGTAKSVGITIVPNTVPYTVTYNGGAALPVNAGSYAVHVAVSDPNYVGSADATLVIQKATAQVTITPASLTQTYNGTPRSVVITTAPAGLATTLTYNGNAAQPVNAGSYAVVATVNDPNYVGTASATLTVQKATAQVTIAPASLTQTYNGSPRSVTVTTVPAGLATTITYNGNTATPVNAGSYAVAVTVSDPNYLGSASATLTVQKATAQVTFTSGTLTQVYSATPKSVTVTTVPAGLACTVTYNGNAAQPVNAGSYAVVATVSDPNYLGSTSGTLVVQKAPATATTGIYVINKGAAIPAFTATYGGLLGGQTSAVVTSVTFSLSPSCTGNAGVYQIIVNATAANYTFTSVNGTLYINPAGAGTKQVKPTFVCYETLSAPGPGGYMYLAHFTYTNQNATPVYIPVGANNAVTGAAHSETDHPTVFQPGGGSWNVYCSSITPLTWQIRSNKNDGTTGAIQANSSNVTCSSNHSMVHFDDGSSVDMVDPQVRVYPNPSSGQVFLEFLDNDAAAATVEVYNALGVKCPVRIARPSDLRIELDLSSFGNGMYIVNVVRNGEVASYRVIIE